MNSTNSMMSVQCEAEWFATSHKETKEILINTHVKAPKQLKKCGQTERAPVSITAVIDRSGSMAGSKLQLVKNTLEFVISHLEEKDCLSIVSYSDNVVTDLIHTKLNQPGKQTALMSLNKLTAGGCTNLAGGLYTALNQQLKQSSSSSSRLRPSWPSSGGRRLLNSLFSSPHHNPPTTTTEAVVDLQVGNLFMGNTWVAFASSPAGENVIESVTFKLPSSFSPSTVKVTQPPFELPRTVPTTGSIEVEVELTATYGHKVCNFSHTLNYSSALTSTTHTVNVSRRSDNNTKQKESGEQATTAQTIQSVWLFTDGHANRGDTAAPTITAQVQAILSKHTSSSSSCSISTFGYGSDHNAELLQGISEIGHGMYYFVETPKQIGSAMVECLAGLLTVYATDLTLHLTPQPGADIVKVHSTYPCCEEGSGYCVKLGEVFSEEQRDVLSSVKLVSLPCAINNPVPALSVRLTYRDISTNQTVELNGQCEIIRPEFTPDDQVVPAVIEEQKNRIDAMKAMEEARSAAERGNLTLANDVLRSAKDRVMHCKSAKSTFNVNLNEDFEEMMCDMATPQVYSERGRNKAIQKKNMYSRQRACGGDAPRFQNEAQCAMVQSWNDAY